MLEYNAIIQMQFYVSVMLMLVLTVHAHEIYNIYITVKVEPFIFSVEISYLVALNGCVCLCIL